MSDVRLRELERSFQQSGSFDDEVAVVSERLRCGVVTGFGLRIAAEDLGNRAAQEALGLPQGIAPAIDHRRLSERLTTTWFKDGDARDHSLATKAAAILALECARLIRINESEMIRHHSVVDMMSRAARDLWSSVTGAVGVTVAHHPALVQGYCTTVRQHWHDAELQDMDDLTVALAIIGFALEAYHNGSSPLVEPANCFLRSSIFYRFEHPVRHVWFHTAMQCALLPHLIGHPSRIPHPPELSMVVVD